MLTIAALLDEFSEVCFSPDCNLIPIKSTDYLSRICKSGKIDFLLVESAWRGPGNTWKHLLVNNKKNPVPPGIKQLQNLVSECKRRNIPTIFWGKEDPVHFKHFIITAGLFDYIATTDSSCVNQYKKKFGHDRVFVLPFAAQTALHKPAGLDKRLSLSCFAGACRDAQYPNRKASMDIVVKPAIKYGLHIYDRHLVGSSGQDFPEIYTACLQGGIQYSEMVKKYREYRVFLNVNSIDNSQTMFSRRVFELLACGTPVISSYSPGIKQMLPEVLLSTSAVETEKHLNSLLFDDSYWNSVSQAGIKRIFSGHTYLHRLKTICDAIHINIH